MRPVFLVLFGYAFMALCAALKNYTVRDASEWSLRRKWYVTCWVIVALISITNALRSFIDNPTFNFYAQIALGAQWLLIVSVPCGVEIINKFWLMMRARDGVLVYMGVSHILLAYRL